MQLKDLIERGYFPKEFPPPFNTSKLANNIDSITSCTGEKTPRKSQYTSFSISKGKISRRFLGIPNPRNFIYLSQLITKNWMQFERIFKLSKYSKSFPVPETDIQKRSVSTYSKNIADFRKEVIETSFSKLIEIRVDISKFYPSIYTHTVSWAFLGKEKAKHYFNKKHTLKSLIAGGDSDAKLYEIAEKIDSCIRDCQEKQSIGVPIGPDTSHIIAELIACRIDNILEDKFQNINLKACRYYDDYYLFVATKDEADQVLKGLQKILADFKLEINESKVEIKDFPFAFEDEFALSLSQFDFKGTENSIKHYFSLIWQFAEKNPLKTDSIFKYALKRFEFRTTTIPKINWELFENLLFKTALVEPSILDIVTRILLLYKDYLDAKSKAKLKELIEFVINYHSSIGHNFEVSWALWLAKTFQVEISTKIATCVIEMKDAISILILLDISKTTNLIQDSPNFSQIESELNSNILFSEDWLLAYEGVKKGWLTPSNANFLDENDFFKILKAHDVEFYDPSKQLDIDEHQKNSASFATTGTYPNMI